ncbi:DUF333 domain-containing protein [Candidatus Woesearchaeota archaeon]|nr:DUF333 domain-containing protein [Candidatus Woesearchaeota archaeon]
MPYCQDTAIGLKYHKIYMIRSILRYGGVEIRKIVFLGFCVLLILCVNVHSISDPSAFYCKDMGYQYKIVTRADGSQMGICMLPNNTSCDSWKFYSGICGKEWSYCVKAGYDIKTVRGDNDLYSQIYGICLKHGIEIGPVSKLMDIEARITKEQRPEVFTVDQSIYEQIYTTQGSVPAIFDWKNNAGDWMTPMKSQGGCGSCWAFAAVGVTEAQQNIYLSNPDYDIDLSEQYLVSDCYDYNTCCGGSGRGALRFISRKGIPDELCMPYVDDKGCSCSKTGFCSMECTSRTDRNWSWTCSDTICSDRCIDWQDRLFKIYDYVKVDNNKDAIKSHIYHKGPVLVSIDWSNRTNFTAGGIASCQKSGGTNHVVVITGYDEVNNYWIVRNSWGPTWNGDGYFKVGFGECLIEEYAYGVQLCSCSSWVAGSCGGGTCSANERHYTRACTPAGCAYEEKCQYETQCSPGKEINVCKSGCTYNNIQSAINAASVGDTILITDGATYYQSASEISWTKSGITLDCQGATLDGQNNWDRGITMLNGEDDNIIRNCNIKNFIVDAVYMYVTASSAGAGQNRIYNNNISNNENGIHLRGDVDTTWIKNNNIHNNQRGIHLRGIDANSCPVGTEIEDNVIYDNTLYGINLNYVTSGQTKIKKNTITNNAVGLRLNSQNNNGFTDVLENTFMSNNVGLELSSTYQNTINLNTFCPVSANSDFTLSSSGSTGDNNLCDKPGTWSDTGTTGCTFSCASMCLNDDDCGQQGWTGQPYCIGNELWQPWLVPICEFAGTLNSTCTNYTLDRLNVVCANGCQNGACVSKSFNLSLQQNWNLISIPLRPSDNSVQGIFGPNIEIFGYKNDSWFVPQYIDGALGYWVKPNIAKSIIIHGSERHNLIPLNVGWNLVGHPYLEAKNVTDFYSDKMVYEYNNGWSSYVANRTGNSLKVLKPGSGYWVKAP